MEKNQLIKSEAGILWHQVARKKDESNLKERSVPLLPDLQKSVHEFAEFSAESGGDRYSSVGTAMNEIQAQSKELIGKVYFAEGEDEVRDYEPLLDASVSLFKALESYYVHCFGLKTGTTGD